MKLGYFTMPLHPPGRDYTETLEEDREAILLADKLGYAEAFVGEHVTDRAENVTSCLMFLASLSRDTQRIKLGSGTVNMPNSHPAAIAAQVAMLDHLLEGRFILGISPGGLSRMPRCSATRQGPQRDVRRGDRHGAEDLGARGALRSRGRVLEGLDRAHDARPEIGQGVDPQAVTSSRIRPSSSPPWRRSPRRDAAGRARLDSRSRPTSCCREWVARIGRSTRRAARTPAGRRGDPATGASPRASSSPTTRRRRSATAKDAGGPLPLLLQAAACASSSAAAAANLFKLDQRQPDRAITPDYVADKLVIAGTVDSVVEQLLAFRETDRRLRHAALCLP